MVKIFNYLYFRLYKFAKQTKTVDPAWTAMLLLSALMMFNLFTILLLFLKINEVFFYSPYIISGLIGVLIVGFNYFNFIYKEKYSAIITEFEKETSWQKIISSVLTILYIIVTWYLAHYL